ncbi:hypothetical protein Paes_1557 [Prosthecochloris aestuarii DSM 271]|uniref:Uncharacterized protein n=1 Tax=Prosthecochloris aestuarii (strain DSM 271 / SK 413) TaxID=290512 RepID=B4S9A5_PROA2|nr:hypothetical protein Paes_1557 [Prosthecochloris aestuarii DSM 271]
MPTGLIMRMTGCALYARDKDHRKDHDKEYCKNDDRRDHNTRTIAMNTGMTIAGMRKIIVKNL